MAALAGLVFGVPSLIAAVACVIIERLQGEYDAVPYVGAATTSVGIVIMFAILRSARLRRRRRFLGREALTEDKWYDRYYGETEFPREVVLSVHAAFAMDVGGGVRPTQLRPDDRLDGFALTFWGVPTDYSFEAAGIELENRFGNEAPPDASSWTTLGDVVVAACQQAYRASDRAR